jgi:hypothetical protein
LHKFYIVVNGTAIAQGYIVTAINPEVAIVEVWRKDDKETATTHYIPFVEMKWDEVTESGFMFGPLPEPP